jgi:hypothetical protein
MGYISEVLRYLAFIPVVGVGIHFGLWLRFERERALAIYKADLETLPETP